MKAGEFKKYGHEFLEWMAEYLEKVEDYPVKSQVSPGDIIKQLPKIPPEASESMEKIFIDFKEIILPGMTHWQHPNFYAYFQGNNSKPSILAEMLTATLGAQCMMWVTSPAATELEERTMEWLRSMMGLPNEFTGVIQDTASTATFTALLSAREKAGQVNENGFLHNRYRAYCSEQAHSSVDKAIRMAGVGSKNLVKITTDEKFAMKSAELELAIRNDLEAGYEPLFIVAALGTTGSTAVDSLPEIASIAEKYNIWLHVDAAYAGSALICPEYRWMIEGIEKADSFVVNPHKWLFTNFDCSAYFVKDPEMLVNTFTITPEYLKTNSADSVKNYKDWGLQLGRRFRALKLWFVIRNFGVKVLQEKIRHHINLGQLSLLTPCVSGFTPMD